MQEAMSVLGPGQLCDHQNGPRNLKQDREDRAPVVMNMSTGQAWGNSSPSSIVPWPFAQGRELSDPCGQKKEMAVQGGGSQD